MTYKGFVVNGTVRLPPEVDLPDGTPVRIEPLEVRPLLQLLEGLASLESDPDAPTDLATQHDHYLYGTPKRDS
jgi:hypothetical protein